MRGLLKWIDYTDLGSHSKPNYSDDKKAFIDRRVTINYAD
jgi:hypothetical protein